MIVFVGASEEVEVVPACFREEIVSNGNVIHVLITAANAVSSSLDAVDVLIVEVLVAVVPLLDDDDAT